MRYTFDTITISGKKYRWLEPIIMTRDERARISFGSATAMPANSELTVVWLAGNTGRWMWWDASDIPAEFKGFVEAFEKIPLRRYEYDRHNLLRQFVR